MNEIKKIIKNQKGSITIFVLAAMIFMLIVIFIAYQTIYNKNEAQIKTIKKIQQEYDVEENLESVYEETANNVTYSLTINYIYSTGGQIESPYKGRHKPGEIVKIKSPEVPGYTPNYPEVVITMPENDFAYTVFYSVSTVIPTPPSLSP